MLIPFQGMESLTITCSDFSWCLPRRKRKYDQYDYYYYYYLSARMSGASVRLMKRSQL
jgi:hypothetical protein